MKGENHGIIGGKPYISGKKGGQSVGGNSVEGKSTYTHFNTPLYEEISIFSTSALAFYTIQLPLYIKFYFICSFIY